MERGQLETGARPVHEPEVGHQVVLPEGGLLQVPEALARYRRIFEESHDGIAVLGPDGRYIEQNAAHARLLGYSDAQLVGKTPAVHLGEEAFAAIRDRLVQDGHYRGDHPSRTADGRRLVVDLTAFVLRDAGGRLLGYVGIKRDVTTWHEHQVRLSTSLARLESIYKLSDAIGRARTLAEIHEASLDCLAETLGFRRAAVLMADDDGAMRFAAWRGLSDAYRAAVDGHSPWTRDGGDWPVLCVPDVLQDPDLAPLVDVFRQERIAALAFIPLAHQGQLLGKLMLYAEEPRVWSDEEIQLARLIAARIAAVIDRKNGEDALRESHNLLQAVLDGIEDAVFLKDAQGRYVMMNRTGAATFDREVPEVIGETDEAFFPADLARRMREEDRRILEDGVSVTVERTLPLENGSRTYLVSKRAHRSADGMALGVVGIARDITHQKRAEVELARRLRMENALANVSARFVAPASIDRAIQESLEELGRTSNASRAYVFLLRDEGRMDNTHEWCASGVEPQREMLQNLPTDAFAWWMERLRRGEAVHIPDVAALPPEASAERAILQEQGISSALAFPLVAGGRLRGFVGFDQVGAPHPWSVHDSSMLATAARILGAALERQDVERDLRVSQERFGFISRATNDAVWDWDILTGRMWWSDGYHKLFGYEPAESEGGLESWSRAIHPDDRGWVVESLRAAIGSGKEQWTEEFRFRRADGSYAVVLDRGYVIRDEAGRPVRMVGSRMDLTDRRRAEEELEAARMQVARSEKLSALGTLVSGVAHEIRTPLTYASNHLHIIRHRLERIDRAADFAGSRREILQSIADAIAGMDRINHLVADLRRFTQLDLGDRVLSPLEDVVEEAVDLFRIAYRAQVEVRAHLQPTPRIHLNKVQVQQVVLNLLQNAAEASPIAAPVSVSTRAAPDGAIVVVEDQGSGIPPDVQRHMLEPFYTTKPDGTGLGLSIVARIVREHGGTLRFDSRPGQGTRVEVFLPAEFPQAETGLRLA